jgi:hypothetical protein
MTLRPPHRGIVPGGGRTQRLIAQARKLYGDESLGSELTNTVYALDFPTIDLFLSLFPWAHVRATPKRQ